MCNFDPVSQPNILHKMVVIEKNWRRDSLKAEYVYSIVMGKNNKMFLDSPTSISNMGSPDIVL